MLRPSRKAVDRLCLFVFVVSMALTMAMWATMVAAEEYVTIRSVNASPYTCTVDGEAIRSHVDTHKASQTLANLALSNPESVVECARQEVLRGELTAAGRALVAPVEEPPAEEPEEPSEPEDPAEPEEPPEPGEPEPPAEPFPTEIPEPFNHEGFPDCPAGDTRDPDWYSVTASNCVIRDLTLRGRSLRVQGTNVAVVGANIDGEARADKVGIRLTGDHFVVTQSTVTRLMGNDKHCITVGSGTHDVWIHGNDLSYCSGDGFQAGHQASGNPPYNLYIYGNRIYRNRENGVDLKYANNVIIAGNEISDLSSANQADPWCLTDPDGVERCSSQNSGSDGSAIIIGSDGGPNGWAVLNNTVYRTGNCVRVETALSGGVIAGNTCRDLTRALQLDKSAAGRIELRGNLVQRTERGIFQNWRENFALDVDGNTFEDVSGPAIEYEAATVASASTLTNNVFRRTGGVIYKGQASGAVRTTAEQINALNGASGNTVE